MSIAIAISPLPVDGDGRVVTDLDSMMMRVEQEHLGALAEHLADCSSDGELAEHAGRPGIGIIRAVLERSFVPEDGRYPQAEEREIGGRRYLVSAAFGAELPRGFEDVELVNAIRLFYLAAEVQA